MGSGKSSVARELAQLLGCELIDLDEEITSAEGRAPAQIIQEDGEPRFREMERQALVKLLQDPGEQVMALGGGTWISRANQEQIHERGATSVWLDAPFALCWKRITSTTVQRPLAPTEAAAYKLFSERIADYELADLRVPVTEQESATEIAAKIVQALAQQRNRAT